MRVSSRICGVSAPTRAISFGTAAVISKTLLPELDRGVLVAADQRCQTDVDGSRVLLAAE